MTMSVTDACRLWGERPTPAAHALPGTVTPCWSYPADGRGARRLEVGRLSPPHALVPPPGGANQQRRIPNTDPEAVMCKLVKESYAGLNSLILEFPLRQHSSS